MTGPHLLWWRLISGAKPHRNWSGLNKSSEIRTGEATTKKDGRPITSNRTTPTSTCGDPYFQRISFWCGLDPPPPLTFQKGLIPWENSRCVPVCLCVYVRYIRKLFQPLNVCLSTFFSVPAWISCRRLAAKRWTRKSWAKDTFLRPFFELCVFVCVLREETRNPSCIHGKKGPLFACFLLNFRCVFQPSSWHNKAQQQTQARGITKLAATTTTATAYLGLLDFNGLNRFKFFLTTYLWACWQAGCCCWLRRKVSDFWSQNNELPRGNKFKGVDLRLGMFLGLGD